MGVAARLLRWALVSSPTLRVVRIARDAETIAAGEIGGRAGSVFFLLIVFGIVLQFLYPVVFVTGHYAHNAFWHQRSAVRDVLRVRI